jgi:hypothetical protein
VTEEQRRVLESRIELVFELVEDAVDLTRQRLRREQPTATAAEIEHRIEAWLGERRSAPFGDAEGRPIHLPRR